MKDVRETCEMISFVYFHKLFVYGTMKESLIIGFTRNTFCLFLVAEYCYDLQSWDGDVR